MALSFALQPVSELKGVTLNHLKDLINISREFNDAGGYSCFRIESDEIIGLMSKYANIFPCGATFKHPSINGGGGVLIWFEEEFRKLTIEVYIYISQPWRGFMTTKINGFDWAIG